MKPAKSTVKRAGKTKAKTIKVKPKWPTVRAALVWPAGLKPTAAHRHWFDLLSMLPPGLRRAEIAAVLGVSYYHACKLVALFGYPAVGAYRLGGNSVRPNWDAVDWSLDNATIAARLGVVTPRVMQVRLRKGLLRRIERPPVAWDAVDWSRPDIHIARDVGRSRERVRQVRRSIGLPPSRRGRRPKTA